MRKFTIHSILILTFLAFGLLNLRSQTHTITHEIFFETEHQSLWGPNGPVLDIDTIIPLVDIHETINFSMPMGPGTDFVISAAIDIDVNFAILGFTLGFVDVGYPVTIDLTFPDDYTFSPGEWVTINSSYDTLPGYYLDAQFPTFQEISLTYDFGFDFDADMVFDFMGFQMVVPIFDVHVHMVDTIFYIDNQGYIIYPCPNSPNPIFGTFGFCSDSVLPVTFDFPTIGLSGAITIPYIETTDWCDDNLCLQAQGDCTWVSLNIDLIQLLATMAGFIPPPQGPAIQQILNNLSGSFSINQDLGGFIHLDITIDYTLLSLDIAITSTMQQDVEFCPTIWTELTMPTAVEYTVTDPENGNALIDSGEEQVINFAAGYDLNFKYPCYDYPVWEMGIRHHISSGFRHHVWDSVAFNFEITVFQADIHVLIIADIFIAPITLFDDHFQIGPLYQNTFPLFWFPITWFDKTWDLPGFNDSIFPPHTIIPDSTFRLVGIYGNNVLCHGSNSGSISVEVAYGVPPFTYEWSNGVTHVHDERIDTLFNVTEGTYYVTITDSGDCPLVDSIVVVHLYPPLTLELQGHDVLCFGGNTGYIVSTVGGGAPPYSYDWAPSGGTASIANNLTYGWYYLTVTDNVGCTIEDSTYINQPALPLEVTFVSSTDVSCNGGSDGAINVHVWGGTPPYSYQWNNGATTQNLTDIPAGTYYLTVTDDNGCTDTLSHSISQPGAIFVETTNQSICYGMTVTLYVDTIYGGTEPYNYTWNTGASNVPITVTPPVTTTYTVTVTDGMGCSTSATVTVFVTPPLQMQMFANTDTICHGDPLFISASITGGGGPPYTLYLNNGQSGPPPITVYPDLNTTMYIGWVSDICNFATVYDTIFVKVNPRPPIEFTVEPISGCQPLDVVFTETSVHDGQTYHWNFGDGNTAQGKIIHHTYIDHGVYDVSLTVTNIFNCSVSQTKNGFISVYIKPTADFYATPNPTDLLNPNVEMINNSLHNHYNYWNFGDGSSSNLFDPIHFYTDTGYFIVQLVVETDKGCTDIAWDTVYVGEAHTFWVPNAFTPDGNGRNERFVAKGMMVDQETFSMLIFSRWGELIFETNDMRRGWDGKDKSGKPVVEGVYTYFIKYRDMNYRWHKKRGFVTVLIN